jgi:hypothetical protein
MEAELNHVCEASMATHKTKPKSQKRPRYLKGKIKIADLKRAINAAVAKRKKAETVPQES